MERKILKKILVIVIVFILTFSNCGYTLQALATSEGVSFLGFNLFGNNMLEFDAYFNDSKKQEENVSDVNSEALLMVELNPKEEGYLKSGTLKAIAEEGEVNFEIKEVLIEQVGAEKEELIQVFAPDATLLKTEQVMNTSNDNVVTNDSQEGTETNVAENIANDMSATNTVLDDIGENESNTETNTQDTSLQNTVITDSNTNEVSNEVTEELVDEDVVVNEQIESEKEEKEKVANIAEVRVVSKTEVGIENIIEPTKLYIKIKFNQDEKLDVSSLYKQIKLQLSGKYIDADLNEIDVTSEKELTVGWSYTKDIEVSSEYTKVSPFEVVDTKGTLIENKIVVKREMEDEQYLPLKQTKIEIEVPELNGKKPVAMEVSANKLKATRGEEINEVVFTNENWEYNDKTNILTITVKNSDAIYTYGEDIYVVTYRYEDYVQENEIKLQVKGKVTVEEFSGKENNIISKDLNKEQKIVVNVGELITYSIGTTEEKINKGKINANYNSAEAVYESEFATTVNINILTNDVLNEFTLKNTKEFYIDKQNLEFEATDVKYKKIKFKYEEISELLEKGGNIEIKSNVGELLYILNSELIKSQENCEIEIRGDVTGVEISFKNITVNGNITVDFVKSIGKCNFDKSAFNNFEKLESRIKAEVKYMSEDTVTELAEIKTEKYFENSFTSAEIELDRDSLSTTQKNENVEIKIALNNHLETSDLYVNPVFELVFPKYVTNVEAKTTNLLYEDELKVRSTVTYKDENIVKMQIALEGVQTRFSTGTLTNGTNIIVSANIEVDKYTPSKVDQIRMYYFNEGVTNYESQTKWTIKTDIPTGILKTTNGFDVDVFNYQAPNGLVTVNEIENYDGANSTVSSIKQGEETRELAMERDVQLAKMRLVAMNNTGNDCTDVMLLGRIPVKNATDVKTGENLGNNVDTIITSMIVPADNNPISSTIYYSANPNATKDLRDGRNAWTETPEDLSQMKSFLIVPMGTVLEGTVFEYTYDFQIPANLPYETKIYGSFGGFYNNHSDVAVVYETTVADKVGLFTKAGPKIEAVMTVDIGDGADVLEERMIKYTISVVNSGSIKLEDVVVKNSIPEHTIYQVKEEFSSGGDYGYINSSERDLEFNVGVLDVGQVQEYSYYVRTNEIPGLLEYASELGAANEDESGVYYTNENGEKIYVTEVPDIYIENQATVESSTIANAIQSNKVKNKLSEANFSSTLSIQYDRELKIGYNNEFTLLLNNISGKDLKNVEAIFNSTKGIKFISSSIKNVEQDEETNKVHFKIGDMLADESKIITATFTTENIEEAVKEFDCYFELKAEGTKTENTIKIPQKIVKSNLIAEITSSVVDGKTKEDEEVKITIKVTNNGAITNTNSTIDTIISEGLKLYSMKYMGAQNAQMSIAEEDEKVTNIIPALKPGENIVIEMMLRTENKAGNDSTKVIVENVIHNEYQKDLNLDLIEFEVENTLLTEQELEEKKKQEFEEELKEKQEEDKKQHENSDVPSGDEENSSDNSDINNTDNNTSDNNNSSNMNDKNPNTDNDINSDTSNENNEEDTKNENNQPEEKTEVKTYHISGLAWEDQNYNGVRENQEKRISGVKVYLYNASNNQMIKSMTTDIEGKYLFKDIDIGKYIVGFEYDEQYKATTYKAKDVLEEFNSDAIENNVKKAITNEISVIDTDINNLDIGLQIKNNFDLSISKYITSAKVTYKDKEINNKYDNVELGKLELDAKKIKGSVVELEYSILIKNEGNVDAQATLITDYIPKDTVLNESKSQGWYLGTDGNAYNETLKDITLTPGQTKELKIVLTKNMTTENTGVVSNKVEIKGIEGKSNTKENVENNSNTQEMIISIRTGYIVPITISTIIVTGIVIISYFIINKKIIIDLKKLKINKIYK